MVADSVAFLRRHGKRVIFDAEHFFDGYRGRSAAYALRMLAPREEAGAEALVLCDTNGGSLPDDVRPRRWRRSRARTSAQLGIHCHNDTGCAVANSLVAVQAGRDAGAGLHQRLRRAVPATRTCRPPSPTCRSSSTSGPSPPTAWSA